MIVCHCHSITDRDLKRAASSASASPDDLPGPVRRAGSCCGSCKPIVRKLLESYHAKARAKTAK